MSYSGDNNKTSKLELLVLINKNKRLFHQKYSKSFPASAWKIPGPEYRFLLFITYYYPSRLFSQTLVPHPTQSPGPNRLFLIAITAPAVYVAMIHCKKVLTPNSMLMASVVGSYPYS